MPRRPHRLILSRPTPVVLSFWTAQAAEIASNANAYELEGRLEDAAHCWELAFSISPTDEATKDHCLDRARICALLPDTETA